MMGDLLALPKSELPERAREFIEWAREMAIDHKPDMSSFILLAWDKDGGTMLSASGLSASVIPRALLPHWVSEVLRRDLITDKEVTDTLRLHGFLAPPPDPA